MVDAGSSIRLLGVVVVVAAGVGAADRYTVGSRHWWLGSVHGVGVD